MVSSVPSLVILISGSGSNLQAIMDAVNNGQIKARICRVISNRADAMGLQRAQNAGIKTSVIDHKHFDNRETFDQALIAQIDACHPDLVILAGFMRILTTRFIEHYTDRLLNIHPSLLPRYKGLNTHARILENGDSTHGASVHLVSPELDSGAIVIQATVEVKPDDSTESLATRVLEQEHRIYPLAISLILNGDIKIRDGKPYYHDKQLLQPLLLQSDTLTEADHSE